MNANLNHGIGCCCPICREHNPFTAPYNPPPNPFMRKYFPDVPKINDTEEENNPYVAEPPGLGLSKWWKLADTHRLYIPAVKHDCRYSMRMCGLAKGILFETSEHADKKFYEDCCKVCEAARKGVGELDYTYMILKTEAEFFYSIVCVVGQYHWPEPLTDLKAIKAEMENVFRCLEILKATGETNVGLCGESI